MFVLISCWPPSWKISNGQHLTPKNLGVTWPGHVPFSRVTSGLSLQRNIHVKFEVHSFNRFKLVWLIGPLCTGTQAYTDRHIERKQCLRHSLRSLGAWRQKCTRAVDLPQLCRECKKSFKMFYFTSKMFCKCFATFLLMFLAWNMLKHFGGGYV